MSRRSQDIPIRPRYGYVDDEEGAEGGGGESGSNVNAAASNPNSSNSVVVRNQLMTSSYSEIPFLAQHISADELADATTPTAVKAPPKSSRNSSLEANDEDDDELEDEDDDSKDSSSGPQRTLKRPNSLLCGDSSVPYELEGSTGHDGQMLHFVANNLEHTLKTATPTTRMDVSQVTGASFSSRNSTPSTSTGGGLLTRQFLQAQLPQIDANVLNDVEIEAQYLAASVDNLTENLSNLLHSISSITADNVEVHKNAVNKLTDSMDANIKYMYTIMAKTEEITKSMKPSEQLGQRIREIKRLVDVLDSM